MKTMTTGATHPIKNSGNLPSAEQLETDAATIKIFSSTENDSCRVARLIERFNVRDLHKCNFVLTRNGQSGRMEGYIPVEWFSEMQVESSANERLATIFKHLDIKKWVYDARYSFDAVVSNLGDCLIFPKGQISPGSPVHWCEIKRHAFCHVSIRICKPETLELWNADEEELCHDHDTDFPDIPDLSSFLDPTRANIPVSKNSSGFSHLPDPVDFLELNSDVIENSLSFPPGLFLEQVGNHRHSSTLARDSKWLKTFCQTNSEQNDFLSREYQTKCKESGLYLPGVYYVCANGEFSCYRVKYVPVHYPDEHPSFCCEKRCFFTFFSRKSDSRMPQQLYDSSHSHLKLLEPDIISELENADPYGEPILSYVGVFSAKGPPSSSNSRAFKECISSALARFSESMPGEEDLPEICYHAQHYYSPVLQAESHDNSETFPSHDFRKLVRYRYICPTHRAKEPLATPGNVTEANCVHTPPYKLTGSKRNRGAALIDGLLARVSPNFDKILKGREDFIKTHPPGYVEITKEPETSPRKSKTVELTQSDAGYEEMAPLESADKSSNEPPAKVVVIDVSTTTPQ